MDQRPGIVDQRHGKQFHPAGNEQSGFWRDELCRRHVCRDTRHGRFCERHRPVRHVLVAGGSLPGSGQRRVSGGGSEKQCDPPDPDRTAAAAACPRRRDLESVPQLTDNILDVDLRLPARRITTSNAPQPAAAKQPLPARPARVTPIRMCSTGRLITMLFQP